MKWLIIITGAILVLIACRRKVTPSHLFIEQRDSLYKPFANFNSDTAAYLQSNFVDRKVYYINKRVDAITRNLDINIVKFYPIFGGEADGNNCVGIYLHFYADNVTDQKLKSKLSPGMLIIMFARNIHSDTVINIIKQTQLKWNNQASSFFRNNKFKTLMLVVNSLTQTATFAPETVVQLMLTFGITHT